MVSINESSKWIISDALGFKLNFQGYIEVAVVSIFVHKTAAVIRYLASKTFLIN